MFQIADTFENALGQLEKLHTLVIWPDATTEVSNMLLFGETSINV